MNGGNESTSITKNMHNLLVLGCSVSDYTWVDKVWGEFLAEHLNLNYIHQAAGCGSNWRMWRTAFNLVNTKQITSKDTIVIQYTEIFRREFWSPYQKTAQPLSGSNNKSFLTETYDDGTITRYKLDADTFGQYTSSERNFFKLYNRFINEKFELEQFHMMHNMFQSFMKDNNFANLYFLKVGGYGPLRENNDLIGYYKNNYIPAPNAFNDHLEGDKLHMNQQGHEKLASFVYNHIKNK